MVQNFVPLEWLRLSASTVPSRAMSNWARKAAGFTDKIVSSIRDKNWKAISASSASLSANFTMDMYEAYPAGEAAAFVGTLSRIRKVLAGKHIPSEDHPKFWLRRHAAEAPAYMVMEKDIEALADSFDRDSIDTQVFARVYAYATRTEVFDRLETDMRSALDRIPKKIVNHELAHVIEQAKEAAPLVRRWEDKLIDLWTSLLASDTERIDLFNSLDALGFGGHPEFPAAYRDFPEHDSPEFLILWANLVITEAQNVFTYSPTLQALHARIGKTKTLDLFPVRGKTQELRLIQSLAISSDQVVLLAHGMGAKWVVKWANDIVDEIENYQLIQAAGGETPMLLFEFDVYGADVLVIERLYSLTKDDDEYQIAAQLLRQLPYLHTFGVHTDIKPDNILRREGTPAKYFLIDMDMSKARLGDGFKRRLFTPLFHYQPKTSAAVATWWHDVLELFFAAHAIALARQRYMKEGPWGNDRSRRSYNLEAIAAHASESDAAWITGDDLLDPQTFLRAGGISRNRLKRHEAVDSILKGLAGLAPWPRPHGLVSAATHLLSLSVVHPEDALASPHYEDLAQIVTKGYTRDRVGYLPPDTTSIAGCITCGRPDHKLRRGLFREDGGTQQFCGTRCQAEHYVQEL